MIISLYSTPRSVTEKMLELMKHPVVVCFFSFKFRTRFWPIYTPGMKRIELFSTGVLYIIVLCVQEVPGLNLLRNSPLHP